MIRVLLCCEGNLDKGKTRYIGNDYIDADGVMQVLIKKTSCISRIDFVTKNRKDIQNVSTLQPKYGKHSTVSRKLAQLAKNENCNHIAFHQDEDNKGLETIYKKVHGYFSAAKEKGLSCIAIVPQHMTESWLLSDENAFQKAFGKKPAKPALPSKPEEIWGSKGTANHPKTIMVNVLSQFGTAISPENYLEIAKHSKIDEIQKRCPKSFDKKFCTDIQSFVTEERAP